MNLDPFHQSRVVKKRSSTKGFGQATATPTSVQGVAHNQRHNPAARARSSNRGLQTFYPVPDNSKRTKSSQNSRKPRKKESQKLRAQAEPVAHVIYKTVLRDEQVKIFEDSQKLNTAIHSQEFEKGTEAAQYPNPKHVTSPKEMTLTASGPHVGNT